MDLPSVELMFILLMSYLICLPKLRLAWRLLKTRATVKLFNNSLALCMVVAGWNQNKLKLN